MNLPSLVHEPRASQRPVAVNLGAEPHLARLERLSYLLDRRYLDPILGLLLPGFGDALGSLLGLYGVWVARKIGAHPAVIARMLIHLALDALIGSIPVAGAIGDFFFRAHLRNLALLKARQIARVRPVDYLIVAAAGLAFALAVILPLLLVAFVISAIIHSFG